MDSMWQRCGSVIIDLSMKFNQSVDGNEVLTVLTIAAQQNKFGNYTVNSINLIASSSTVTPSTPEPDFGDFVTNKDGTTKWEHVAILAVVGVVIIFAIVACVACWVHKKRNIRKDPRVHDSAVEEQPLSRQHSTRADVNPYAHDNNGYAVAGPTEGQYAVEDKSKKKKKEELDATYAQVDMSKSKKSKKQKAKPGECMYADFNQMREMPKVSISPQPLPPIKKPTPYGETEYADISQFLKEGAKLPGSNNSQGQATETGSNFNSCTWTRFEKEQKAKPGECMYADFNQMREMPKVSISPQPLPPIKKPTPYGETEYADISQFLKEGAKLPGSNNSQGQATETDSNFDEFLNKLLFL
ncbi:hypothetical protein OS493_010545 [Desmophyllum pertusum]|uniref:Uncharacterized protein n=1 Tax=Desmophyllum pertusum TaxID=174260 RepID=A0A9X0A4Z0_9CNID|nr:hypothetical protein OS493_010545 [Desmophyllum pertusum]